MTVLATAIGCAFLIILASIGFGAQRYIVQDLLKDRSVTEISVQGKEQVDDGGNPRISEDDIEKLESIENVQAVTRKQMVENQSRLLVNEYGTSVQVSVVDYPSEIESGFELDEGRMPEEDNEIIVGYNIAEQLHTGNEEQIYNDEGEVKQEFSYDGELIGEEVSIEVSQWVEGELTNGEISVEIVGIGEEPTRDWMNDTNVFISEATLGKIEDFTGTHLGKIKDPSIDEEQWEEEQSAEEKNYQDVKVYADNVEQVESISTELKDEGYYVYSVTEELDQVNVVFAVVKAGLIFVGAIALLIASIGIYNTMSMAVTERTQDIGIMKAVGGHPKLIRNIFLMESAYIGLIGAFIGVVVAYIISFGINFSLPVILQQVFEENPEEAIQLSYIPPYVALLCILLSIGIAILSGLKPARKATKIDVLRALRRDI